MDDRFKRDFADLISYLGDDPNRQGMQRTPHRHLESLKFLTSGYHATIEEVVGHGLFDEDCDEMVLVKDIEFYSLCEHHLLPFFGKCHVGYIPDGKIIGLSKVPRIVDAFSRRFQLQERLTSQIAGELDRLLAPKGVGVVIEASHLCMMMRGVSKQRSATLSSSMLGCFRDGPTRQEFFSLVTRE